MTAAVYQLRIVPAEPDPHVQPRADIYTRCTRAGCENEYLMDPPDMRLANYPSDWLDAHRPRFDDIQRLAVRDGWSRHPETGALLCPGHTDQPPLAALPAAGTAHRQEQAITDTAEIDVDAVKAALEDEGEDDAE